MRNMIVIAESEVLIIPFQKFSPNLSRKRPSGRPFSIAVSGPLVILGVTLNRVNISVSRDFLVNNKNINPLNKLKHAYEFVIP